jgi:hypothetical protein
MIRRGFWLAAGAVLGVTGYRKATRLARMITSSPAAPRALAPGGRAAGSRARQPLSLRIGAAAGFARDVRDGMAEYRDLHARQLGRRLDSASAEPAGDHPPAGRGGSRGRLQP